ncbi:MAG: 3-dehydroquinate synthase [Bacillota bacterium]
MQEIWIELGQGRRYPVVVGTGHLLELGTWLAERLTGQCLLVTNATLRRLYGGDLKSSLQARGWQVNAIQVPDGEEAKTLAQAGLLYDYMLAEGFDRDSLVIALGGGVVGDLAGFVAGTFMRGIPFIQVPTSLLAQVDASIGGKTAVNHRLGKNLVGIFHQPRAVWTDVNTLATLPEREFISGLAEVIKHGVIDADYFALLEATWPNLLARDPATLVQVIAGSVRIKGKIVAADEREAGQRALLNLGHTIGHALEAASNYRYSHGEAVAIGLVGAGLLACRLGLWSAVDHERTCALLRAVGLPIIAHDISAQDVLRYMAHDKKARADGARFVLPVRLGEVKCGLTVPVDMICDALAALGAV